MGLLQNNFPDPLQASEIIPSTNYQLSSGRRAQHCSLIRLSATVMNIVPAWRTVRGGLLEALAFEGRKLGVTVCRRAVSPCAASCGKLIKLLNATLCRSALLQWTCFYGDSC